MKPLLMTILTVALVAPAASQTTIDRIAATVEREVITSSEIDQLVILRVVPRTSGEGEPDYRRRVLDTVIAQTLRFRDVERFGAADIPADAIEARLLEVRRRFGSDEEFAAALHRTELTIDDLRAILKRQLQVEAYIEERFSPLIFVSLEEIERYYRDTWVVQRRARGLDVPPLNEVREEIRNLLKAERLQSEIEKWTGQLRARANVDVR